MMYHQRPPHTPEQREKNHHDMVRCWWVFIICWAILCLLSASCQRKAYAPRHNPKPAHIGLIRDREEPQPRYSPHVWADDTTN